MANYSDIKKNLFKNKKKTEKQHFEASFSYVDMLNWHLIQCLHNEIINQEIISVDA